MVDTLLLSGHVLFARENATFERRDTRIAEPRRDHHDGEDINKYEWIRLLPEEVEQEEGIKQKDKRVESLTNEDKQMGDNELERINELVKLGLNPFAVSVAGA